MGRRGKTNPTHEAEEWQVPSHERLSARAEERRDNAAAPSYYGFEKMATRPIAALATGEPIAPGEVEVRRTGEQAARYHYRTSQKGQIAAGFEPQRHSVTICGRPVQVTVVRKSLECFCFALTFLFCVFAAGLLPASVNPSP